MQFSGIMLYTALRYLPAGEPGANDLGSRIRELMGSLKGYSDTVAIEQTGLLESNLFQIVLCHLAYQPSIISTRRLAAACLRHIAASRGLTRQQLEDQLAPGCGLDGGVLFDYGLRRFTLALGNHHRPLVRDAGGRLRTSLPHRRAGESAELVALAKSLWQTQKQQLSLMSRTQTARLEQAMLDRRRWSPAEFSTHILGHPLMAALARRLVWAGYNSTGELLEGFCLGDDRSPTSEAYTPVAFERYAAVGLPHPVDVDRERRLRWGELLGDFHVAPLFPQAGRPVYGLAEGEQQTLILTRFQRIVLRQGALLEALSQRDWEFDSKQASFSRRFEAAQIVAVVEIERAHTGQIIARCSFERLFAEHDVAPQEGPRLLLGDVDPLALSEVLWELSAVTTNLQLLEVV